MYRSRRYTSPPIGTNDLLQYLFAVDRVNADVAAIPDLLEPDVLRFLRDVADAAHAEGAWIGVCGEAAADPLTAAALVGAGADELSATPAAIPEVKAMLRGANAEELVDAVNDAIGLRRRRTRPHPPAACLSTIAHQRSRWSHQPCLVSAS
jgi:phosphoenolpyruvate-protein kinase (PTS system EI component)